MGLVTFQSEKDTKMTSQSVTGGRNETGQETRKKRTFDIAFLTGQGEKEEKTREIETERNNNYSKVNYEDDLSQESSASSMIDVMTNGSLSGDEEPERSPSPQNLQPHRPTPVTGSRILLQSHPNVNNIRSKSKNLNAHSAKFPRVKEEIRFESKRTIDINHSNDSLKIKENLQFSTMIPTSSHSIPVSQHQHDFIMPFALFPQFGGKFPMGLGPPSINGQSPSGPSHQFKRHNPFQDMYSGGGYSSYPNLIISPQFSPQSSGGQGQGQSHHYHQHHQQQSQSEGQMSPPATLLPPSLTALTLPAQNVCAKCNIGFRMTSDLVYHMRSHHKRDTFDPLKKQREEKLKCPVCHESFRERHHLTRHMTAHQDRIDEGIHFQQASAAGGGHIHGIEPFPSSSNAISSK